LQLPAANSQQKANRAAVLMCLCCCRLCAVAGKSFRAAVWASSAVVEKAGKAVLLRNFISKQNTDGSAEVDIDPRWYQVRAAAAVAPPALGIFTALHSSNC
jgi:hypothetical protein